MRIIFFLLIFFLVAFKANASAADSVCYEQKAVEYFISLIDSIKFLCFDGKPFNKQMGKIYLCKTPRSGYIPRLNIYNDKYLSAFFEIDSLVNRKIPPDSSFEFMKPSCFLDTLGVSYIETITSKRHKLVNYSELMISVTPPIEFTNFKIVELNIDCKSDWVIQKMYIKFDNEGMPLGHVWYGGYQ